MFLLAFDTSMAACSVCVYDTGSGKVLAANFNPMDKGQAEALAPMVELTMQQAGIGFSQLHRVAVTTGPGTFTGIRIGLAFARGLGVSLAIPVIGINSLQAIAANEASRSYPIIVTSDARGGDIYIATFDAEGRELTPPAIVKRESIDQVLPAHCCLVMGSAGDAIVKGSPHIRSTSGDVPVAANFVHLAALLIPAGYPPEPLYLRPPDVKLPIVYNSVGIEAARLLAEIHGECFDHPWSETSFGELLANRAVAAIVASNQQVPVSFVLFRNAVDEAEILTICTRPALRKQGLAKALLQQMESQLKTAGIKSLFIEVAVSNLAALALYVACGFQTAGLRKNYYDRGNGMREDAHIMRKGLTA